jgi:hypothetical protein
MKFPIHLVPLQKYELTQFDQCPVPCKDHVVIIRGECQMVKEWTHYNYVMIAVVERAFPSRGSTSWSKYPKGISAEAMLKCNDSKLEQMLVPIKDKCAVG